MTVGTLEVLLVAGWLVFAAGIGLLVWRIALARGSPSGNGLLAGVAAGALALLAGAVVIVLVGVALGN